MTHAKLNEVFSSFQGEGLHVGRWEMFVRFNLCNLHCTYCDTPESLVPQAQWQWHRPGREGSESRPNPVPLEDLAAVIVEQDRRAGPHAAVNLTGGEPLLQAEFLGRLLPRHAGQFAFSLETNGTHPDALAAVLPWIHTVSMDIKPPSSTGDRPFWDAHAEFLRIAVTAPGSTARAGVPCRPGCGDRHVFVKIVVTRDTDPAELDRAAELVRPHAAVVPVFLQPVTPFRDGPRPPDGTALRRFAEPFARAGVHARILPQIHPILGIR